MIIQHIYPEIIQQLQLDVLEFLASILAPDQLELCNNGVAENTFSLQLNPSLRLWPSNNGVAEEPTPSTLGQPKPSLLNWSPPNHHNRPPQNLTDHLQPPRTQKPPPLTTKPDPRLHRNPRTQPRRRPRTTTQSPSKDWRRRKWEKRGEERGERMKRFF